ncbi:13E12 repeat family protein [Cryobacterium sp. 1639]|uniref:DUF222 domain-containing protein n=1 Tax=Cryobacterium inferilacus TaxID=2866629 RepID=UPI001C73C18C|nr:DUF222 domain-containing protein [Cryobacterium sp. 1639]MBX0300912.1 13E12 repeat family protein [Cryobacterium sp. 1639]
MPSIAAVSAPDTPPKPAVAADSLAAAVISVERLGACSTDYDALTDAELLAGQRDLARLSQLVETRKAWLAKTLAHRSRPELGQQGLAAQQGFLSPAELIQNFTGSTRHDARKLVDVGRMLADTEAADAAAADEQARRVLDGTDDPGEAGTPPGLFDQATIDAEPVALPWYAPISRAAATGTLSVAAAHAIRTGLGDIDAVVTAEKLADAVHTLVHEATRLTVDELLKRARRMRDSLDEAGIAVREKKAWDDRYLRVWRIDTGQVHVHGLFPPEQGQYILDVYDSLTGPRRGGVRFVDPDRAAWAKAVQDDPRSTDQLTADGFLELLKAGSTVNPDRMLGGRTPAVRILTTAAPHAPAAPTGPAAEPDPTEALVAIPDGTGHGFIEGNPTPVSQETIDRIICTSGTVEVSFDADGQPLNLGREDRVFSQAQRLALAARDGGCMWGECDKPPSRTEAHHLEQWLRDHGSTDIRSGILLCPPHHLLLHNQGWQIFENHGTYWLRPPAAVDPGQTLIRLRSKSPAAPD